MNYALHDSYVQLSHRLCLWFSFTPPSKPHTVAASRLSSSLGIFAWPPPSMIFFVHKSRDPLLPFADPLILTMTGLPARCVHPSLFFFSYLLLPTFEQRFFRGRLPFDNPILPPLPHFSLSGPPGDLLCLSFHSSLKSSRHLSMTPGQWITGNVEMDKGNEANIYGTVSEG